MQDSHKQQPQQQQLLNHATRRSPDDPTGAEEWDEEEENTTPMLPGKRLQYVLSIGLPGGLLATLVPVALTLINAAQYQEAAQLGAKMSYGTASLLFWLGVSGYIVELVIGFFTGFIVGKLTLRRRPGFYAGLLMGAIASIGHVVVGYIPGYPGNLTSNTPNSGGAILGGILFLLVLLLVRTLIDSLMALWGVRTATRRLLYYQKQEDAV